ncbi:MAG: hypothetical protein A4E48_00117 [Methanosaeta sp. PtaU1.Bin060]|nr:MAG: hypothetical protein A4E48_00117 [Methanosaeta sp. PtaU1.Bin060]
MPPDSESSTPTPGRRTPETTEGGGHRRAFVPKAASRNKAWLPWSSNGREHGLRIHGVNPDGTIREIVDRATKPKPDVIKRRQARKFAKWRR